MGLAHLNAPALWASDAPQGNGKYMCAVWPAGHYAEHALWFSDGDRAARFLNVAFAILW